MMKYIKLFLILVIGMTLQGCPGESEEAPDAYLTIKNTSNQIIYYPFEYNNAEVLPIVFPKAPFYQNINSNAEVKINVYFRSLKDDRKLWILIYKKTTIDSHTWKEIQDQGIYDKRYELTLEQLKSMNYELTYDGN